MKKLIKWALIIVPVLVIIVVAVVVLRLDGIAKRVVETQATASTTLNTTLDSAHISIFGGQVSLKDLKIASPKGFEQTPTMFDMGELDVMVSYGELRDTPMRISEITVDSPRLVIEQRGGKLNVNAAMDQMPASEPSTLRLAIGSMKVKNTQLVIRPGLPMLKPEYQFVLPSVELKNVGMGEGAENGAAIKDVLRELLVATMARVRESESIPEEIRPFLTTSSADLQAQLKQEVTRRADEYLNEAKGEGQKQVQQGLQNLLNRNAK